MGIGPHGVADGGRGMSKPAPAGADKKDRAPDDGSQVVPLQEKYIRAALAGEEVNRQAVEEARKLLESGQLDSPEAARRGAEAILTQGG